MGVLAEIPEELKSLVYHHLLIVDKSIAHGFQQKTKAVSDSMYKTTCGRIHTRVQSSFSCVIVAVCDYGASKRCLSINQRPIKKSIYVFSHYLKKL